MVVGTNQSHANEKEGGWKKRELRKGATLFWWAMHNRNSLVVGQGDFIIVFSFSWPRKLFA